MHRLRVDTDDPFRGELDVLLAARMREHERGRIAGCVTAGNTRFPHHSAGDLVERQQCRLGTARRDDHPLVVHQR
jgi:hypothetical protein